MIRNAEVANLKELKTKGTQVSVEAPLSLLYLHANQRDWQTLDFDLLQPKHMTNFFLEILIRNAT